MHMRQSLGRNAAFVICVNHVAPDCQIVESSSIERVKDDEIRRGAAHPKNSNEKKSRNGPRCFVFREFESGSDAGNSEDHVSSKCLLEGNQLAVNVNQPDLEEPLS